MFEIGAIIGLRTGGMGVGHSGFFLACLHFQFASDATGYIGGYIQGKTTLYFYINKWVCMNVKNVMYFGILTIQIFATSSSLHGNIELIVNFFLKESVTTYRSLISEIHIIQAYYIMRFLILHLIVIWQTKKTKSWTITL